jgi:hypothetical protein
MDDVINALKQIGLPVKPNEYKGTATSYIVVNEEAESLTNYANDLPQTHVEWWQVHLFSPINESYQERKMDILHLLIQEGYTIEDISTMYENETSTKHVVISARKEESEEI